MQTIEEGERRRAQSEELVSELNARRNQALAELDNLYAEIGSTIERHRPGSTGTDREAPAGRARERLPPTTGRRASGRRGTAGRPSARTATGRRSAIATLRERGSQRSEHARLAKWPVFGPYFRIGH
jgi:hypothetical protein